MEEALPEITIATKGSELSEDRTPQPTPDPDAEREEKQRLAEHCITRFKRWVASGRGFTFMFALPDDVGQAMMRKYATQLAQRDYVMTFAGGELSISVVKP